MIINVCDRCGRQFSGDAEYVFGKMLYDVCGEEGHRDGGMTYCAHKTMSD